MRFDATRPNRPAGLLALFLLILSAGSVFGEAGVTLPPGTPSFKAPVFVTTCGQSPGALMVKVLCRQAKVDCIQGDLMTADELAAKAKSGGTLFVTTGTSGKGMGAAGIDVGGEVKRCQQLMKRARELGMRVIVGQIEGTSRRSDESDEQSIRAMSPLADLLITRTEVNGDGYFTRVAQEKNIPQIFIEQTLDLGRILPALVAAK